MIQVLVICLYVLLIPVFWAVFAVLLSRLPNSADQPPAVRKRVSWTSRRGNGEDAADGAGGDVGDGGGTDAGEGPPTHFRE